MTDFSIQDQQIDGPHGRIPVRTYLPAEATRGLVWAHGGAFAFGGLDDAESDWVARALAERGTAVVAVDYRLAPVTAWASAMLGAPERDGVHFPVASEEVGAAYLWATTLVPTIDTDSWALGGASAGANLAAGAALRLRDVGGPRPASLVLAYGLFHAELPALSAELAATVAALPPEKGVFTPELVQLINSNYVGDVDPLTTAYAFPGGHDLTGLPPVFLLNAELDSLRASGERFAVELAEAGNDLLIIREPGVGHGHFSAPDEDAATRSIDRVATWLDSTLLGQR